MNLDPKTNRRAFVFMLDEPGHILVWPVRDPDGSVAGWEVLGPYGGALGGDGLEAEAALALVRENINHTMKEKP